MSVGFPRNRTTAVNACICPLWERGKSILAYRKGKRKGTNGSHSYQHVFYTLLISPLPMFCLFVRLSVCKRLFLR